MDYSFSWLKNHTILSEPCHDDPWRLVVRAAQFRDLKKLAEILTDSFHSPTGWLAWTYPFLCLGIYEDLRARFRAGSHYGCFAAIASRSTPTGLKEEITGTVEIALRPLTTSSYSRHYPYISNLAVSHLYRRRGIARQLLLSCEPRAMEWGFKDIYLHVLENNEQAKRLYLSLGYRVDRIESGCMSWLFQQPRRLLLHKSLCE